MTMPIRRQSLAPTHATAFAAAVTVVIDGPGRHPAAGVGACFSTVLHNSLQKVEYIDHEPIHRVPPVAAVRSASAYGPLIVAGMVLPAPLPR